MTSRKNTGRPAARPPQGRPSSQQRPTPNGRPVPRSSKPGSRPQPRNAKPSRPQPRPNPARQGHAPAFDQDAGRPPMKQQNKRLRRKKEHARITKAEMRRRRLRRQLLAVGCLTLAVAGGVLLSVTLLFRINTFEFQNMEGQPVVDTGSYTQAEILQALEVKDGDNLFSFLPEQQEQLLDTKFPLLENVEIRRRMPGTVVLRVQPAQESFAIQTSTGWLTLSRQCKVIAMSGTQPNLPLLIGPVHTVPQVGQTLSLGLPSMAPDGATPSKEDVKPPEQAALEQLLAALNTHGLLDAVTQIDVSNPEQIYFGYQDRIRVILGTVNQLDYKMKFAAHLLENKEGNALTETDRGVLDMSIIRGDGSIRPTFKQCDPELPSHVPAEEPPADGADPAAPVDPNAPVDPAAPTDPAADGTAPEATPAAPDASAQTEPSAQPDTTPQPPQQ